MTLLMTLMACIKVEMLSIVDLDPSNENCIYSTLIFLINQAKSLNIPTSNVTFDQPLHIKVVDITLAENLNIIIRLRAFYISLGNSMKGSALEDVLGLIFEPTTIEHVISKKAYARAICGHFFISICFERYYH